jgi:hypothetical protein
LKNLLAITLGLAGISELPAARVSFGRRLWVARDGSVHYVGSIPLDAVIFQGAKAFAAHGLYWDASLKVLVQERANLACPFAGAALIRLKRIYNF